VHLTIAGDPSLAIPWMAGAFYLQRLAGLGDTYRKLRLQLIGCTTRAMSPEETSLCKCSPDAFQALLALRHEAWSGALPTVT
jgi:hypothetical protein